MMKINVVIIEDEKSNSSRLKKLLNEIDEEINVVTILESLEDSISWFNSNNGIDLYFMDIQLSDGIVFELFNHVKIDVPIIFTTAYDEYAIRAFKVNCIDYLLKPIDKNDLEMALDKYNKYYRLNEQTIQNEDISNLIRNLKGDRPQYRTRFLVKQKNALVTVPVDSIAYISLNSQIVTLFTLTGTKYILDLFLDEIEADLDPSKFFRINRQFILNITAIKSIVDYPGNRFKIFTLPVFDKEIVVSRERVPLFKMWLGS